ncbi:MAG: VOC family protein [Gemmatimonadetes bacterium]|nr:VOC family protein [Gemmatimonadota bacterium]
MATRKKAKKAAPKKASKKAATKKSSVKKSSAKKASAAPAIAAKRKSPETLRLRGVSPSLTVGDLHKSIAWYRDVLGFVVGETWVHDGEIRGCELLAGTARFYLGQDDWAKGRDRKKGEGFRLHCATAQSVDDIAANVKKSGGKLDSEPATMSWGARQFAITDPDGFKLSISSEG